MKKVIASLIATIMVVLMIQVPCFAAEKVVGETTSISISFKPAQVVDIYYSTSNMAYVSTSAAGSVSTGSGYITINSNSEFTSATITFKVTGEGDASASVSFEAYCDGNTVSTGSRSTSCTGISQATVDARNAEAARQAEAERQAREAEAAANRAKQQQEKKNNNNNNDNQQQENLEEVPTEELPQEQPEVIAAPVEQKPKSDFKFRSIPIKLHEMLIKAMEQKTEQLKKEQEARINAPEKTEAVKVAEVKTEEIKEEVKEEKTETANKVVGAVTTDNGGSNGGNFLANVKLGDMAIVAGAIIGGCLLIMTSHLGKSTRKEKQNHLRERV